MVTEIIETAEQRRREQGVAYRGALLPQEAWRLLQQHPRARLVDIRTREEWDLVGTIPGALLVSWKLYPDWGRNPAFLDEMDEKVDSGDLIILICRSGVRSREAAEWLTREGYRNVFNVLQGFEGDKNEQGQRVITGWKAAGLPWTH